MYNWANENSLKLNENMTDRTSSSILVLGKASNTDSIIDNNQWQKNSFRKMSEIFTQSSKNSYVNKFGLKLTVQYVWLMHRFVILFKKFLCVLLC